jgi:hypothetical protein
LSTSNVTETTTVTRAPDRPTGITYVATTFCDNWFPPECDVTRRRVPLDEARRLAPRSISLCKPVDAAFLDSLMRDAGVVVTCRENPPACLLMPGDGVLVIGDSNDEIGYDFGLWTVLERTLLPETQEPVAVGQVQVQEAPSVSQVQAHSVPAAASGEGPGPLVYVVGRPSMRFDQVLIDLRTWGLLTYTPHSLEATWRGVVDPHNLTQRHDGVARCLAHPRSREAHEANRAAASRAAACLLVTPATHYAYWEAGQFAARGKPVVILQTGYSAAELCYLDAGLVGTTEEAVAAIRKAIGTQVADPTPFGQGVPTPPVEAVAS